MGASKKGYNNLDNRFNKKDAISMNKRSFLLRYSLEQNAFVCNN